MPRMWFVRPVLFLAICSFVTGCGFIHFGRLPSGAAGGGDAALAKAYSDLTTEHKILKQELALVRRQADALRVALEKGAMNSSPAFNDLAARLTETSRELATLRAANAKLEVGGVNSATQSKLAASLRETTQLEEENIRLRAELDRARGENVTLAEQLKTSTAQNQQAQSALAQLNLDLLAEKQARARAEQAAAAIRTQLSAVVAQGGAAAASTAGSSTTPAGAGSLQLAKAPPAESSSTAELRANVEQLQSGGSAAASAAARTHTVRDGDTLEQLARRYYQAPEKWRTIYEANRPLLENGQPLRAGTVLRIPE